MKKTAIFLAVTACGCGAFAADTTLKYVNVDDVAVGDMSNGIPASTGLIAAYNTWGFPAVLYPDTMGVPKRNAANANEKVIRFRDSDSWNFLYAAGANTDASWNVADQRVSFFGYAKWSVVATGGAECDFGVVLRQPQSALAPGQDGWLRQGYFAMFASKNSSWGMADSTTYYPTDMTPFVLSTVNGTTSWNTKVAENPSSVLSVIDGWHNYVAEAKGTTIRMYIDGVQVCEGTNTEWATGYPMVTVYWDDQSKEADTNWTTLGIEELKFEQITNFAGVSDWSQF